MITIGALLGMAARLDGKFCTVLDSTGMAQKNGAVMSHVRIGDHPRDWSARITAEKADLVLAYDMVVATTPGAVSAIRKGRTRVIANSDVAPTAAFLRDRDFDMGANSMFDRLVDAAGKDAVDTVAAQDIARRSMGDAIGSNTFLLGFAFQKGAVPLSLEALMRAIELNGVAVDFNKAAFEWGRRAALDPESVAPPRSEAGSRHPRTLDEMIEHRVALLTAYQDAEYARRFREAVESTRTAERQRTPGMQGLAETVAKNLAKLMAYKDEYEVARLYTDGTFRKQLASEFDGDYRVSLHMAPPFLSRHDPVTGEPKKRTFGPWIMPVLGVLARMKALRGTAFDPFGRTAERKAERQLVEDYFRTLGEICSSLNADNFRMAMEILSLPDQIRGFGHIKFKSIEAANARRAELLERFRNDGDSTLAA